MKPVSKFLENFIEECIQELPSQDANNKAVDWTYLTIVLLIALLPELKEWIKLGLTFSDLKRQELRKKLQDYAVKKELDYKAAEKATDIITKKINSKNILQLTQSLEENQDENPSKN